MGNKISHTGARVLTALLVLALVFGIPLGTSQSDSYAETAASEPAVLSAETAASEPEIPLSDESAEAVTKESAALPAETLPVITAAETRDASRLFAATDWYYGHESEKSYTVRTVGDMQGLSNIVNAGIDDFAGKTVTLAANLINLSIVPIGTETNPFAGTFDGGGHSLTNLSVTPETNRYVGLFGRTAKGSVIQSLDLLGGTLTVAENNKNGAQIRYVGALVGYAGGAVTDCDSTMDVRVSSKRELGKDEGIMRDIGGLAGYIAGNMTSCTHSGDMYITSDSNINEDMRYLIGEVGGLAGAQGDATDPLTVPVTELCRNSGDIICDVTGSGGKDRFGQQLYSVSFSVGGIIGQTSGSIRRCENSGIINTSNGPADDPEAGRGANNAGGIVGSLRGTTFGESNSVANTNMSVSDAAYRYYKSKGGASSAPASYPKTAGVYDCINTGTVVGLAAVGGIVGNGGSFTEVEGCVNTADVKGCRWNKPFAGGIAGNIQSSIRYCYNRGNVYSVTGGGYYCAGIAGGLWSPNTALTPDNERAPVTEMTGCYNTGRIYTDSPGFRTGILAGENEGHIHDNAYLSGLSLDNQVVHTDTGTTVNNTMLSQSDLKGSKGRSVLNAYAAGKGGWKICYLPAAGNENGGYPVLSRDNLSVTGAGALPASATLTRASDAQYSAMGEPIPKISLTGAGTLLQNADYRVIPQAGANAVTIGRGGAADTRPYTATIEGIGAYKGVLSRTISYGIEKANIGDCTIVSETAVENWERQSPLGRTKLIDTAGNEVPSAEYTISDLFNDYNGTAAGVDVNDDPKITDIRYYDYRSVHGDNYKYDVRATATASGNYTGATVQPAFRIMWASMYAQVPKSDPAYNPDTPEAVVYGDVVWQGRTWDFQTALKDKTGNVIKITYTGKPITPTVKSVTYLGRALRQATDYDYQAHPLDYDYKYIYGNPNPEETGDTLAEPVNVTVGEPTCMTMRFTNGGNFTNYTNVFFRIVPADIGGAACTVTNQTLRVTWNGTTLTAGVDYTASKIATAPVGAAGTVTITG
ncbi:MAG: hypothetical protein LBL36_07260, partial [Clostridiales Family XIII bacterium]|nr:hypothetical protein [Clostridiales Family XIII bacterium]